MDVNSINNNNISTLNSSSSLQLEKSSSSSKVNSSSKDALNLNINDYNKKRDELSLNVQSLNNGIAASKIAQNSIEKQQEYLSNIQDKLEKISNYEDKNDVKQSINQDLRSFNQIAYETKFNKESLLVVNNYDEKTSIDVNTKSSNFSIEKPNTATYANEIFETVNNSNLNDPNALNGVISKVANSAIQLQNTFEEFTEFGNRLETSARETIKDQINLFNENKFNKDKNFGNESSDFSKSNVNANVGYLAASQANIVQEQSVRLLS
jgi:flagellin-like hook-associated protein FlgL